MGGQAAALRVAGAAGVTDCQLACTIGKGALSAVYSYCINRTGPMTRTAAETAAFKAQNLAQRPATHTITRPAKPARKSQRQEWQEFRVETLDMINAAKRQGHFHILPQLLQRLNTANEMVNNRALA